MSDNRGIFTLDEFYDLQVTGLAENILDVFLYDIVTEAGPNTGYFVGGYSTSPSNQYLTQTQRVDFSNDTATAAVKGNLDSPSSANNWSGTGSMTDGYVAGANAGGAGYSNGNRIDYSNDTALAASKSEVLVNAVNRVGAVGTKDYGYWGGGTPGPISTISRLDFSNDSGGGVSKGNLSVARYGLTGVGNQSYGYMTGGLSKSTVDRIDYSSDTSTAAVKGPLASSRYGHGATGNSNYGYVAGGYPENVTGTTIQRIDYASDTGTTSPKGTMSKSKYFTTATGSGDYGYIAGGREQHDPGQTDFSSSSTVERIDFSNDTATAAPKGPLAFATRQCGGVSARMNGLPNSPVGDRINGTPSTTTTFGPAYGYISGGGGPPYKSKVDRIDFANDTATASTKGPLSASRAYMHNMSSPAYGYNAGGNYNGGAPLYSLVDRIDFANDTATAAAKGSLSVVHFWGGGASNNSYGYAAGGATTTPADSNKQSTVDRVDFASDTDTAVTKGPLSLARLDIHGAGNQSYGYFGGGYTGWPNLVSTMDRIDYSNDTAEAAVKGPLSVTRGSAQGSGNADYGYFMGGVSYNPTNFRSNVDRVDYSNDTPTTSPKGNLSLGRRRAGGTGDRSYGYCAGGAEPGTSVVDRIDFANDTATAAVKGPLTATIYAVAGTGARVNANGVTTTSKPTRRRFSGGTAQVFSSNVGPAFGYALGGRQPGSGSAANLSTVDRIDYSNDTATAATKGSLSAARYNNLGRHGTHVYGYLTGGALYGYDPSNYSNHVLSTTDRIDYASDTPTMVVKGPMVTKAEQGGTTLNPSYAWIAGGDTSGYGPFNDQTSVIQRFDYGSDSATTVSRATLPYPMYGNSGTSSPSYGYYYGGHYQNPPNPATWYSTTFRLDFANDTGGVSPKGTMNQPQSYPSGYFNVSSAAVTGNADFGYVHGGSDGNYFSSTQRLDYSNDTAGTVVRGRTLAATRTFCSGTGNPDSGYVMGGGFYKSYVERVDYANDTTYSGYKGPLTQAKMRVAGVSAQHFGLPNLAVEAPVQPPFSAPTELYNPANNLAGGYTLGSGSYVQRINYSNDTATAVSKGNLAAAISYHSAVSSFTHAYTFGGSPSPSFRSIVQRVSYANDTATATTVANLAQPVYRTYSGMGNKTYGYQSGGQRPSNTGTSEIDRIEYASDTSTGLQKGNLASSRYLQTATGNLSYGYVCGGSPPFQNNSLVQRVDYGNDTATATPKGPLHQGSRKLAATGTASYGYVAGGTNPDLSSTTRIDYSNDTATSVQKGSMTVTRENFGAMSSPAYGYYTGGSMPWPQPSRSSTDRIDYSNDTATASPKGILSVGVSYFSAASGADIAGALQ